MTPYRDILAETSNGVARITINWPERMNAFSALTVDELIDCEGLLRITAEGAA